MKRANVARVVARRQLRARGGVGVPRARAAALACALARDHRRGASASHRGRARIDALGRSRVTWVVGSASLRRNEESGYVVPRALSWRRVTTRGTTYPLSSFR